MALVRTATRPPFSPRTRGCSYAFDTAFLAWLVFPAHAGMFPGHGRRSPPHHRFPRVLGDVPLRRLPTVNDGWFSRALGNVPEKEASNRSQKGFPHTLSIGVSFLGT